MAISITIALTPSLLILTYIARRKPMYWIDSLLGGGGWFIALLLRLPLLGLISRMNIIVRLVLSAFLAGIFEEGVRYVIMKFRMGSNTLFTRCLTFGLGWGLFEALVIYCFNVPLIIALGSYTVIGLMAGAIERNIAILIHVTMTLLIALSIALAKLRYFVLAVTLHALIDCMGITTLLIKNPLIIETLIAIPSIVMAFIIINYSRRVLEKILKK